MKIEIVSTEDTDDDRYHVTLRKTHDDGTVEEGGHIFPHDTLEWRAAEYGIDPSDVDTLLDIVVAEPYLTAEDWATGPCLYDEDVTTEQARVAHIARCARVKLAHRVSTRARRGSPLQHVRDTHHMDHEAVAIKRAMVEAGRENMRAALHARRTRPGRLATLRATLAAVIPQEGSG